MASIHYPMKEGTHAKNHRHRACRQHRTGRLCHGVVQHRRQLHHAHPVPKLRLRTIESEAQRVHGLANQLAGRLDEAASNDKVLMGVGMVLFWPVLFALGGTKQQEADYARLNGEYSALQQAMIAKKCDLDARPVKAESLLQPPAVAPILPAASADVGTPGR